MAENSLTKLPAAEKVALSSRMLLTIGDPSKTLYPTPASTLSRLTLAKNSLDAANVAVANAKAAYHAAVQDREAKDAACGSAMSTVAAICYASPDVDPSMIAALGLSPRSRSKARIVPQAPADLSAYPEINGDLLLVWPRGISNRQGVIFRVDALISGAWKFIGETTASKMRLSGYAPGQEISFRVSAARGGQVSAFSPVATIYPASGVAPALRLAA